MDAYTGFAAVYDLFMDNIPYEKWAEYLIDLLKENQVNDGLVLDLGCGTGGITEVLARSGYDMIGVDYSEEMLQIARQKMEEHGFDILYLLQDMREFELYGTVRAVVSICDSMNYLLQYEELVQTFSLVNNYLDPGGIFIFDMNTPYKYETVLGQQTIAENRDEGSFIWENYFDAETGVNEYELTLFIRETDGRYEKYEETHFQRAYGLDEIRTALNEAGLSFLAVYDTGTRELPGPECERFTVIARENGKTTGGIT